VGITHWKFSQIWLQAKYESNLKKKHPSIFLATLLETVLRNLAIFLNFGRNLAIGNLQKAYDFCTSNF
jgi:hypothetical protein